MAEPSDNTIGQPSPENWPQKRKKLSDFLSENGTEVAFSFESVLSRNPSEKGGNQVWVASTKTLLMSLVIRKRSIREVWSNLNLVEHCSSNRPGAQRILKIRNLLLLNAQVYVQDQGKTFRLESHDGFMNIKVPHSQFRSLHRKLYKIAKNYALS